MVTRKPLACRSLPREAEIIPFPKEEVTPPVTNIYLADAIKMIGILTYGVQRYTFPSNKINRRGILIGQPLALLPHVSYSHISGKVQFRNKKERLTGNRERYSIIA